MGRYDIAAIVAKSTMKPPTVVSTKFLFLNRNFGIKGCLALLSASAKRAARTAVAANKPMITGLFQSYSTPPQEVASVKVHTAAAIKAMPQMSKSANEPRFR